MSDKRKRRRWWRWPLRGLVGLFVLLALLVLFHRPLLRHVVLPLACRPLDEVLGLETTVERVEISWSGRVVLEGIRCAGPKARSALQRLEVKRLELDLSLADALAGRRDFLRRVTIVSPRLEFDLDRSPFLPSLAEEGGEVEAETLPWPRLLVRGGELRLRSAGKDLVLRGIDASLVDSVASVDVAERRGDLGSHSLAALEFPLHARVRLEGGDADPLRRVVLETLTLAGEEMAADFAVEREIDGAVVRFGGAFPAWGLLDVEGGVDAGTLALGGRGAAAPLAKILAFVLETPPDLDGRLSGPFQLIVPLEAPSRWWGEARLELVGARFPRGMRADALYVDVERRRLADGELDGEVHLVGLRGPGIPDLELTSRVTLSPPDATDGFQLRLDGLALHLGERRVELSATLVQETAASGLRVEDGRLEVRGLTGEDVEALVPGLDLPPGRLSLELAFRGSLDPATWEVSGDVDLRLDDAEPGSLHVELRPELRGCVLRVADGFLEVGEERVRFTLEAQAEDGVEVRVAKLDGELLDRPLVSGEPFRFEARDGGYSFGPLELAALGGRWSLAAEGSREGPHRLRVEVSALELDADLLGALAPDWQESLDRLKPRGQLHASVAGSIDWRQGRPEPDLEFRLRVDSLDLDVGEDDPPRGAWFELEGALGPESLVVERLEYRLRDDRVSASLALPIRWDPAPRVPPDETLRFSVDAVVQNLSDYVALHSDEIRELDGALKLALEGEVHFDALGRPVPGRLLARVALRDGTLKFHGDLPSIDRIYAELLVRQDTVLIHGLRGVLGGSEVEIRGAVDLAPPWSATGALARHVDLRLRGANVLLVRRPELRVRGDLDLHWRGPWERSTLGGEVRLTRAYYLRDLELAGGRPSQPFDLFHLESPPLRDVRLDLRVRAARSIVVKNNLIDARASADLRLEGTGLDPLLIGIVSSDRGTVRFGNSTLKLRSAIVEFVRNDPLNPRLQISLHARVRGHDVSLAVSGSLEEPEVMLESSPPLPRDQVLVLVSTGYTLEQLRDDETAGRVAAVEAAKYLGSNFLAYLSRGSDPTEKSFFDRVTLETESASESDLGDLYRVEVRVLDRFPFESSHIFAQSERDFYGDYNFNLGWRFDVK
ncbi:MAG: translocation/assembly module TamB domain-containing protein [Planctomycetota bacterium]|nr:translocation/assembly module TamB domain-containing protein [Planctomycetota bacterium]